MQILLNWSQTAGGNKVCLVNHGRSALLWWSKLCALVRLSFFHTQYVCVCAEQVRVH